MKSGQFKTESDLAKMVVQYFTDQHYEVYQEVRVGGGTIDLVAVQGPVQIAIECKLSFGLSVMRQAYENKPYVNMSYVAVPQLYVRNKRRGSRQGLETNLLEAAGLGCLIVHPTPSYYIGPDYRAVEELVRPRFNRKVGLIKQYLHEEQKTFAAAGNNAGQFWSPFKATCQEVYRYVRLNPGVTIKEVVSNIKTHYRRPYTAQVCLLRWILEGKVAGLSYEQDGTRYLLYTTGDCQCP
jgi:hypothetical protein